MKSVYLSLLLVTLISCNSDNFSNEPCIEFKPAGIETVLEKSNADASGFLFDVEFGVDNACGQFDSFNQTTNGTTTTIQVIAKYEGCVCTQETPLRHAVYFFSKSTPGTYILKFKMKNNSFIAHTVIVN